MLNEVKNILKDKSGITAIIIKDSKGNRIDINPEVTFPSASLIKLFVLLSVTKDDYKNKVKLKNDEKVGGFGMLQTLDEGLELTVKDLCYLMICLSDNTATNMLIDYLGIEKINKIIIENGFKNTVLGRKMMDMEGKKRGLDNFTSAEDVLKVLEILFQDENNLNILKKQMCNSKLPLYFFRKAEFAHKTGDLVGVEHDAGRLFLNNEYIDIVVLTKDLENNKDGVIINNLVGELVYNRYKTI